MQTTDILIHVNEELEKKQQKELESELRKIEGVIAPRFNKRHLLLIVYNSEILNTNKLLSCVKSKGYQAQLVGF